MTELNFLLDVLDFQKIEKRLTQVVQAHVEQLIEIAEDQNLLQLTQSQFQEILNQQ
jgi:hypothetical protein